MTPKRELLLHCRARRSSCCLQCRLPSTVTDSALVPSCSYGWSDRTHRRKRIHRRHRVRSAIPLPRRHLVAPFRRDPRCRLWQPCHPQHNAGGRCHYSRWHGRTRSPRRACGHCILLLPAGLRPRMTSLAKSAIITSPVAGLSATSCGKKKDAVATGPSW